eukprot:INCI4008.2.p1 GENE.INCI4008.2~~INCI4008.2.p1  ORF type:complete len:433 (+),score=100.70 INCI4008.2:222-1520(+)
MVSYLTRLAKAAVVFAALAGGNSVLAQEEELTREEVIERISRVEAAIEEHRAKGEDEHVAGATGVLEQLQAALRDFDAQGGAAGGGGGRAGGPPQGGEEEEDVFSILDQDQDGRISRDEFAQGFEQEPEGLWDNEDANGDGFISFEEFGGPKGGQPARNAGGPGGAGEDDAVDPSEVFYMMDTSGDNRISKEEFETHFENLGVEPNLALFKRDDTNSDGFIAFEEFGLNRQNNNLFAQLDADGNQELTREEFQVEWHTAPIELFENDDKNGDGVVSFEEFGGPKGLEEEGGAGGPPENMFAVLDADQNGEISQAEFNVDWHNAPEGLWEQEDANGDGVISFHEFSGPKGQGPPQGQGQGQGQGPPEGDEEEDVFSVLDQDQDGRISREEFVAGFDGAENEPEGLWEQEDANKDGFISWSEFGGPKGAAPKEL